MTPMRICRQPECGNKYQADVNHPGNILDCPDCAKEHMPPPRGMMYSVNKHSTDRVLTITSNREMADAYAKSQKRATGFVLTGLVERKTPIASKGSTKCKHKRVNIKVTPWKCKDCTRVFRTGAELRRARQQAEE